MRIYLLEDEKIAIECRQLIRLKSDCGRLEWSRVISSIPADVTKALSAIDSFVDEKLAEFCADNAGDYTVSEREEARIMTALRKNPALRNIVGSCVVLKSELQTVVELLKGVETPILKEALNTGKSLVID